MPAVVSDGVLRVEDGVDRDLAVAETLNAFPLIPLHPYGRDW